MQNQYNLAQRADDALITDLARHGIAYVPLFPLGGFSPLQSAALSDAARHLGATPMQVALALLLQRSPNILVIPGTSSIDHLRENLAAASLLLPAELITNLDSMSGNPVHPCHSLLLVAHLACIIEIYINRQNKCTLPCI